MTCDLSGRVFGAYRLLKKIGDGTFGDVYSARHTITDEDAALKVKDYSSFEVKQEAELHKKLSHPNIVSVKESGAHHGKVYMVMEHCNQSLRDMLNAGSIQQDKAVQIALDVLAGLEYVHENGIAHRDVKPENILESKEGVFKLCDFGLFQPLTQIDSSGKLLESIIDSFEDSNVWAGTPQYMAPEQEEGRADHRSDLFAVGTILYEMLTGHRPDGTYESVGDRHLDAVIKKSRYRNSDNRFQSAKEMREALAKALEKRSYNSAQQYFDMYEHVYAVFYSDADPCDKADVYEQFLAMKPKNARHTSEVYNALGCIQMESFKDYGSAKESFAMAIRFAEKDVKQSRDTAAKEKLAMYRRNLDACKHNLRLLVGAA
jgi:serine/threonine-protein kinase